MSDNHYKSHFKTNSNILPSNKKTNNNLKSFLNLNKRIETKKINNRMQLNKINIKHYNKIKNKVYFIIILRKLRFLLIINFIQILSTYLQLFNKNFSKITLKVKGIGFNNILGRALGYLIEAGDCSFKNTNYPNEIYINGIRQKIINYSYYFNETYNLVELIWNNNIKIVVVCFMDVLILQKLIYLILILQNLQICTECFFIVPL